VQCVIPKGSFATHVMAYYGKNFFHVRKTIE
jgi:hypothetical protein